MNKEQLQLLKLIKEIISIANTAENKIENDYYLLLTADLTLIKELCDGSIKDIKKLQKNS